MFLFLVVPQLELEVVWSHKNLRCKLNWSSFLLLVDLDAVNCSFVALESNVKDKD